MNELVKQLKKSAIEAVTEKKPVDITIGEVVSESPLKIQISQKIILEPEQLLLTPYVQDIEAELTVNMFTEMCNDILHQHFFIDTGGDGNEFPKWTNPAAHPHRHIVVGKVASILHLGLKQGETALLLRVPGGQKFIVLCRLQTAASDFIKELFG